VRGEKMKGFKLLPDTDKATFWKLDNVIESGFCLTKTESAEMERIMKLAYHLAKEAQRKEGPETRIAFQSGKLQNRIKGL
jgi:hypothetical protein